MINKLTTSVMLFAGLTTAAAAQDMTMPRWSSYAGCWSPVVVEGQEAPATNSRVCILPTGGNGADLVSVTDNKVLERTRIDADAAHHDVSRQGCTGWEAATWSPDGRRLYFTSDQTCSGLHRVGSGLFAIGSNGRLTNVVGVSAGGGQSLRVLRYAPAQVDTSFPADVVAALLRPDMSLGAARIAAQRRVDVADVIEASKAVDASVVQSWVASSEQQFKLDANTLVRLADGGVAPQTIDVMVAVSNPSIFAVMPRETGVSTTETEQNRARAARDSRYDCYSQLADPWGYSDYGYCDRRYGYSPYGYGYDPYFARGYGYGYGYGSSFGYSYGYPYYGGPVVVVVKGDGGPQTAHGRMTKDGYTNSSSGSTAATTDRAPTTSTRESGGSTSSGSSSGGSSSSGSSGRVAHSKPPKG